MPLAVEMPAPVTTSVRRAARSRRSKDVAQLCIRVHPTDGRHCYTRRGLPCGSNDSLELLMASSGSKKFRDFAANEASAAINKALSTRLNKSAGDLQAFRKTLDEAAKTLEKALGAAGDHEATVAELVEKMTQAAAADTAEQVQRIKTEADSIIAAAKAELGKAVEAANEARGQAARARDAHAKAEVARREVDAALQRESKEKDAALSEAKDAKALLDGIHAKQKAVEEQRVQ